MDFADTPQGDILIDQALELSEAAAAARAQYQQGDQDIYALTDLQTAEQSRDAAIRHALSQGISLYPLSAALGMPIHVLEAIRDGDR